MASSSSPPALSGRPSAFQHLITQPSSSTLGRALVEAARGVGRTWPNPPVGCVIVDEAGEPVAADRATAAVAAGPPIVARGFHAKAGERHAEVVALDDLIEREGPGAARGKTVVVTLEPCAHHGRTPPCVDRLIAERVARVVVGTVDPNPKVNGGGIARLRAAGIDVVVADPDVYDDARRCQALISPFARSMKSAWVSPRPYVVLKVATSLDGKMATRTGASRWITGSESRALVHRLRDACDAVVTGSGTILADDPALTVRDVAGRDPLRVVLDRRGRAADTARVFADGNAVSLSSPTIAEALAALHARGLTSVLIEAGPALASSFLQASDMIDELWWFQAPVVVGGDGLDVFGSLNVETMDQARRFDVVARVACGADQLTLLRPLASS